MAAVAAPGTPLAPAPDTPPAETMYQLSPELAALYAGRNFAPLWVDRDGPRREAFRLARMLEAHDQPSQQLEAALLAAQGGNLEARTRAELMGSKAFSELTADLNRAPIASAMRFAPAAEVGEMPLATLAAAENGEAALDRLNGSRRLLTGLVRGLHR